MRLTRIKWCLMNKAPSVLLFAVCFLSACKSSGPGSTTSPASSSTPSVAASNDAVDKKMLDLAGSGASNCGRLSSQATADLEGASKCAMQAAQQKRAFYVAYDMPGMTVGVVGNSEGKLFSVQSQAGGAGITSEPCPAELRIAPSGRMTCYPPGTFPMGSGAGSHSNMTMPSGMPNPHQQSAGVPQNPHQSGKQKPAQ